ncbi:hypothetical protein [Methanolobus vulcani]|uniref:DUF3592 domain-containing protein n=1 Tax=Methanolobus vulcani TaxID=38026 RepID=A0A7Z8P2E9_9EURY|nr:hypothetical protein [Methanolobus vulcani]TQD28350.1 hypothetical protein FKV42_01400 [Methanolobus vulcani]
MDKQRTFSLGRILTHDYCALVAILMMVIPWAIYFATSQFGYFPDLKHGRDPLTESSAPFFKNMGYYVIFIAIPMLGWRIHLFKTLYKRGVEITGYISFEGVLSRKRIEYKYTYEGVDYWRGNALTDSQYVNIFKEGDEVILLVDPKNPKQAVIKEIYF